MRRLATAFLALGALAVASSAFAVDFNSKSGVPQGGDQIFSINAILFCDNGSPSSGLFQDTNGRFGNKFPFGASSRLTRVEFLHYGFGFAGPYNYNLELWDPTSCTMITAVNGLVAGDAANAIALESLNLCLINVVASGDVIVAIDPNTCAAPNDCYPDLLYDGQINVVCPYVVDVSGPPICQDASPFIGPFLFRIELDNCPVKVQPASWGVLKQIYR